MKIDVERELSLMAEAAQDFDDRDVFHVKKYEPRMHGTLLLSGAGQLIPTVHHMDLATYAPTGTTETFKTLREMIEAGWLAD